MQISTDSKCYLFRLNKLGIFDELKALLEDENIIKIGLSIHDDFNVMRRTCDINPKGFIDLQTYVKQFHIMDISLQKIYAILFGERISKNQRLTNWEAEALTEGQQHYAAIDAWACLRIYNHLRSGAFVPAESQFVVEPHEPESQEQSN
jgi:ribonuclease D